MSGQRLKYLLVFWILLVGLPATQTTASTDPVDASVPRNAIAKGDPCDPDWNPPILLHSTPVQWSYQPLSQSFDIDGVVRPSCSYQTIEVVATLFCDQVTTEIGTSILVGGYNLPYHFSTMAPSVESECQLVVAAKYVDTSLGTSETRSLFFVGSSQQQPTVTLDSPVASSLVWPGLLQFAATTVAAPGSPITSVEFVDQSANYPTGQRLVGIDSSPPYSIPAQTLEPGVHSITAIATDSRGFKAVSSAAQIVSAPNQAPVVRLTQPVSGSSTPFGTALEIRLEATDADGFVRKVDFLSSSTDKIGTIVRSGPSSEPYVLSWTPPVAKSYQIYAIVEDNLGLTKSIGPVPVTVGNAAPLVTLNQPTDGAFVAHPTPVTLSASAVDDQAVSQVSYVITSAQSARGCEGATIIATAAQGFSTTWTPPCGGRYRVQARVTDALGVTGQSAGNDVFVTKSGTNVEPFTRLNAPTNGQYLKPGMVLNLSAQVRDDGSTASSPGIASVNFYLDGVAIKTLTTYQSYNPTTRISVWTTTYTLPAGTAVGLHQVTANAQEQGLTPASWGISPQVPINIVNDLPTTASLSLPGGVTTLTMPTTTTLTATMLDPDGSLVRNEFYRNDILIAASTPPQLQVSWSPTETGPNTWRMRVLDSSGIWTEARLEVDVLPVPSAPLPTVSILNPLPGQMINRTTGFFLIRVLASASNGAIQYVDLYDGSQKIGRATNSTYDFTLNWQAPTEGVHRLTARAVGPTGTTVVTSPINVFVTSASPQISIVSPASNTSGFVAPENVWASVIASDDVAVTQIAYYLDGVEVGRVAPSTPNAPIPLDFLYPNLEQGKYTLRARAFDAGENFTDSPTVTINVAANVLPTVSMPVINPGPYVEGTRLRLDAVVNDADEHAINRVEFINASDNVVAVGQLRLSGPTPTYSGFWTPAPGNHMVRARVFDRREGMGLSSPSQSIIIDAADPPQVSFATPVLPGPGNMVFAGEAIQLSAQVSDQDPGGHITLVEFRRHFTLNDQATSEVVYSSNNGGNGTYSFDWVVPLSAVGQTSTFSVTAKDDGPAGRNTTTVNSTLAISIQHTNRGPSGVRFMPRQQDATPVVPAMPSYYAPRQQPVDSIGPYRVQANSVLQLCAFADDADGNLAGVRFYLEKPGISQERLLAVATERSIPGSYCFVSNGTQTERGFVATANLEASDANTDVQFIRAEAFDARGLSVATMVNPERGESGHIACIADRFEQWHPSHQGSPCIKFSIPIGVMDPAAATTACGNSAVGGGCDGTRFALPPPPPPPPPPPELPSPSVTVLEAERYDAGGQGLAVFEKNFIDDLSPRGDRVGVACFEPPAQHYCRLTGLDNGEYRRYSVTMPESGTIEYTVKFKPHPYAQLTAPARDVYIGRSTPGNNSTLFNEVTLQAKATADQIGDSQSKVDFILQQVDAQGNSIGAPLILEGGYTTDVFHSRQWRPTYPLLNTAQSWKVAAKISTRFVSPEGEVVVIGGDQTQMSEFRTVHFVDTLPAGYVPPEPVAAGAETTDRGNYVDLGEIEGRAALPDCILPPAKLELYQGSPTGWFLQKSCRYGLPANDYYFNLHSEADGTEVDSVAFEYVSSAISGISLRIATPNSNDEFPVGAPIGFQVEFEGAAANQGPSVTYVISRVVNQTLTEVARLDSSLYPAFQQSWSATETGNYSVAAVGRLTATAGTTTATPVSFRVSATQNSVPQVTLTSPAANLSWQLGAPLSLAMTATDTDGINPATVRFVLIKDGDTGNPIVLVADQNAQDYSYSWAPEFAGVYSLSAYARDTLDALGSWPPNGQPARVITVTASTTPTVSFFASPSVGLIAPASTELRATVTGGSNISVQFEHDTSNTVICSGVPQPGNLYTCTWDNLAAGSYGLHARAFVDGQEYVSASINLVVTNPAPVSATRTYVYDEYERLCKVINPESGATFFGYDLAGNLAWTLEGSNLTGDVCDRSLVANSPSRVMRSYDEMNRLKRIDYPAGTDDVRYDYELDGALKTVEVWDTDNVETLRNRWTYTYNNRRMTQSETLLLDGESRAVDYAYNVNGHLESLTYPGPAGSRRTVEYAPNGLGQPKKVADAAGTPGANTYANAISYYPNGAIEGFTYGNGIKHEMLQNERFLPKQSLSTRLGVTVIDDRYHYDDNGNVIEILDYVTPTFTRSMDYDALDRLTHVAVGADFWNSSDYTYDALDNIRTAKQGTRQFRYLYDNSNKRLTQMYDPTGSNHIDLEYNPVGDVVSKLSLIANVTKDHDYIYDAAHRLLAVPNVASYEYDGHGRRVKEIRPTQADEVGFYNQAGQKLYTQQGSTETHNIYFGGSLLATLKTGTPYELTYLHTDALGSVVAKSSGSGGDNGTITARYRYTPYGEDFGGTLNGLGYTGHDMDQETGLTYMQQRYYDPVVSRFLSMDPVASSSNTGGNFNRYSYASNSPYRYIDPDGRKDKEPCGAWLCQRSAKTMKIDLCGDGQQSGSCHRKSEAVAFPVPRKEKVAETLIGVTGVGGTAISLYELSTGQSPLTNDDASRVWAAVGLIPFLRMLKNADEAVDAVNAVSVTVKGLDRVEAHLDDVLRREMSDISRADALVIQLAERAMLQRLRNGNQLTVHDIEFYLHELKESAFIKRGFDQSSAHEATLNWRGVTEFDLVHPDVIKLNPESFSKEWKEGL